MTSSKSRGPSRKSSSAAKRPARAGARELKVASTSPARSPAGKRKKSTAADTTTRLRKVVLGALDDMKARDVRELDVRGRSDFADLMVLASGTSSRHVASIADEVVRLAKQAGTQPLGVEGADEAEWVLVDLGDIVVHVMQPRIREFYGLERLWSVGGDADDVVGEEAIGDS